MDVMKYIPPQKKTYMRSYLHSSVFKGIISVT